MAAKDALDKVKMPARAAEEDMMLELEAEDMEMDEELPESSPLADLSDDELLAEVKARGLKLDMEDEMEAEELELMDFDAEGEEDEEA